MLRQTRRSRSDAGACFGEGVPLELPPEEMVQTADQPTPAEPAHAHAAFRRREAPPKPAPVATPIGTSAKPSAPMAAPVAPPVPARAPRSGPRRTRVVVRKVAPLSVLKFSLLFYVCLMLIVFFAMVIVYGVLSAAGAIDSLEKILGYVFGTGTTSTSGAEPLEINGRAVFTWGLFGGLVFAVIWSLINVFIALLYNLISDIVGGVEVTLAERPSR